MGANFVWQIWRCSACPSGAHLTMVPSWAHFLSRKSTDNRRASAISNAFTSRDLGFSCSFTWRGHNVSLDSADGQMRLRGADPASIVGPLLLCFIARENFEPANCVSCCVSAARVQLHPALTQFKSGSSAWASDIGNNKNMISQWQSA